MRERRLWTFAIILFVILCASVYYLFLPVVIYVQPDLPKEYLRRLSRPSYFSASYRLVMSNEEDLMRDYNLSNPDLVIFSPMTENPGYITVKTYCWGISDKEGFDYAFLSNDEKMFITALERSGAISTAFVYEESSLKAQELFESLKEVNDFIYPVVYKNKISDATLDNVINELEKNQSVAAIVHDPETAHRLLSENTGIEFYVDFRDYAALYSINNLVSIEPDWKSAIDSALSSKGDVSFDYTLRSTNNVVEVFKDMFLK